MASESSEAKSYSTDPALYIYTSLTAGSSHIVTATSRLETILRANRIPFKAIDIATDEKARMLWGRRAGKDANGRQRKLPGLVQMGMVLGDIVEIEEWNEYGELKDHVTFYYDEYTQPSIHQAPKQPPAGAPKAPSATTASPAPPAPAPAPAPASASASKTTTTEKAASAASTAAANVTLPVRSIAEEAAAKAKQVHLQSLRDKVYGKDNNNNNNSASTASTSPSSTSATASTQASDATSTTTTTTTTTSSSASQGTTAGLQSPTSSGWKAPAGGPAPVQSPTSTGWKPRDVEPPVTELHGAPVERASAAEIAAVEEAEAIREEGEEKGKEDDEEEGKKKEEGRAGGEAKGKGQ
ncbi:uncharacterized protein P884DRAFT_236948 [Thermothelomyces heterothallicus CBS 202.75]|uniref:uncharacterized protein n=1 Tax=Thermothelomyces heterothallicus CBS 202.75 TaxID=1149848 RepID=UPI003743212F